MITELVCNDGKVETDDAAGKGTGKGEECRQSGGNSAADAMLLLGFTQQVAPEGR